MNAVRLFHRMPSIYPVHHRHRSSLLTCRYDGIGTSPLLATSQALIRSSPGLSLTMPPLAEVSPRTGLYASVNPITRMK